MEHSRIYQIYKLAKLQYRNTFFSIGQNSLFRDTSRVKFVFRVPDKNGFLVHAFTTFATSGLNACNRLYRFLETTCLCSQNSHVTTILNTDDIKMCGL